MPSTTASSSSLTIYLTGEAVIPLRSVGESVSRCPEIGLVFGDRLEVILRAHTIIVPVTDLLDEGFQVRQIGVWNWNYRRSRPITSPYGYGHMLSQF